MIVHKISRTDEVARKRVAAYCRVSTGMAEQEESYERQVSHYERLIRANPAWEYAGVYADQGSGTRVEGRDGFKQLLADAMGSGEAACARVRHRRIDLILVKSISRFSRNMADCDRIVRELKAAGVEVRFEKENISTFDASAGFIFSVLAAVAQDESRSISENIRWSIVSRFRKGQYSIGSNRIFGYDSVNGRLTPNACAPAVRRMFELYAAGEGCAQIARQMTAEGVRTLRVQGPVTLSAVRRTLRNETYVGDKRLQKQPPRNYLTKRPDSAAVYESFYLTDDHEAVVSRETWNRVQELLAQRRSELDAGIYRRKDQHPLYGRVFCGGCGAPYLRRTLRECPERGSLHYKAWSCKERVRGRRGNGCRNRTVREDWLLGELQRLTGRASLEGIARVEVFAERIDVIVEGEWNT